MVVELQQDLTSVLQISEAQLNRVKLFTNGGRVPRELEPARGYGMAMLAPDTN